MIQSLVCGGWRCRWWRISGQNEKQCTCQYGHIGQIENAGAKRSDADIEEVRNTAVVKQSIDQIADSPARDQA